jgi:hypothetical protein
MKLKKFAFILISAAVDARREELARIDELKEENKRLKNIISRINDKYLYE